MQVHEHEVERDHDGGRREHAQLQYLERQLRAARAEARDAVRREHADEQREQRAEPAARKLFLSGVSAEKSCVAKMLSFGSLILRTSLKFVSVHSEGHQTVTPGGFSSAFVLKAIVMTQ